MPSKNGVKSVAFTGLGNIGKPLANEFVQGDLQVTILTRDASKADLQPYAQKGAKLVTVDYNDEESLKKALNGIDVVISTLGATPDALTSQQNLAKASKAVGVKLFVPSDWGSDYRNSNAAPLHPGVIAKVAVEDELKKLQLPYFTFSHGLFAEWLLMAPLGFDVANRKALITGDGKSRFTSTHLTDIASFAHKAITTLDLPAPGQGRNLFCQGFSASWNELLAISEKIDGKKWERSYQSVEPFEAKQTQPDAEGFFAWLTASFAGSRNRGLIDSSKLNHEEVGWSPKVTKEAAIKEIIGA